MNFFLRLIRTMVPLVVVSALVVSSCEKESECVVDKQIRLKAGFYFVQDSVEVDTSLSDLTVYGVGAEDTLYRDTSDIFDLWLPLSPYSDTCSFVIETGIDADTLFFSYQRELVFYSQACGILTLFELDNVRVNGNMADSLEVVTPEVNTENEEHVKIYL